MAGSVGSKSVSTALNTMHLGDGMTPLSYVINIRVDTHDPVAAFAVSAAIKSNPAMLAPKMGGGMTYTGAASSCDEGMLFVTVFFTTYLAQPRVLAQVQRTMNGIIPMLFTPEVMKSMQVEYEVFQKLAKFFLK